jgi:hypothetical protein
MPTQVQVRRGTTAEHSSFTGAVGELTVDTDKDVVVIHDGSTAGGHPMLKQDGSNSALALGSASSPSLKFTGDTNTGIYSPGADQVAISTNGTGRLTVSTTAVSSTLAVDHPLGAVGTPSITFTGDLNTGFWSPTADTIAASTGGSERLRIDSSGRLGLGSSNPTAKFVCDGSIQVTNSTNPSAGAGLELGYGTVNASRTALQSYNRTGSAWLGADYNALDHRFYISGGGSPQMTLTSTGLGIGTTSPGVALDCTGAISAQGGNAPTGGFQLPDTSGTKQPRITNDAGNATVIRAGSATGGVKFNNFANNSELVTIDNSGRLLVGTTTQQGDHYLQVQGSATASSYPGSIFLRRGLANASIGSGNQLGVIDFGNQDGGKGATISAEGDAQWGTNDYPGRLVFSTTADGASSPTERMRLTNQGAIWAAARAGLSVFGAVTHYHGLIQNSGGQWVLGLQNNGNEGDSGYGLVITYANTSPNGTGNSFIQAQDVSTIRFQVRSNGGIANYQANDVNLCDEREKKNIETLDSTWDCLKHWELKKFHYNEDADTDDQRYGVIAQQIAEHCPEVITDWVKQEAKEAVLDDDGNEIEPAKEEILRFGVKEQQMMWMAIKALQEAQTRIETLEAEVAALKGA